MKLVISKAQFKPKALKYLKEVQEKKIRLIITHWGKPVIEILPLREEKKEKNILESLRGTVIEYKDPTEPIDENWEVLK